MARRRAKTSQLQVGLWLLAFIGLLMLVWQFLAQPDGKSADSISVLANENGLPVRPDGLAPSEPGENEPAGSLANQPTKPPSEQHATVTTLAASTKAESAKEEQPHDGGLQEEKKKSIEPVPWSCPDFVKTPGLIHGGHPSYTVEGLCHAAAAYNKLHRKRMFLGSSSDAFNRQELAAFLAHVKHESAGMAAVREYRCCTHKHDGICKEARGKKNCHYCDPNRPKGADDPACPCEPSTAGQSSRLFYGRGPLQLSWNFHYGALARAFGMPEICNQPDLVADKPELLWGSAVWYWMEQHDPNCVDDNCHGILVHGRGFGGTTQNVNGCLECAGKQDGTVCHRAKMFISNCKKLNVEPLRPLDCGGRSCEEHDKKHDKHAQLCAVCRSDFKCGSRGKLADGSHAKCDAKGEYPCCSATGWCGNSDAHCTCSGCTDFRNA